MGAQGMLYLFSVTGHFQVHDRGSVMIRGASLAPGSVILSNGTKIRLRPPLGPEIDTHIKRFEITRSFNHPSQLEAHVWLPDKITREEVPLGTRVFLLEVAYQVIPDSAES